VKVALQPLEMNSRSPVSPVQESDEPVAGAVEVEMNYRFLLVVALPECLAEWQQVEVPRAEISRPQQIQMAMLDQD